MLAGHSCLGSQANHQCPSFPVHCTSGSLLPAAVTCLATSCSGASQELRPQQAPSSQQANSPLNYCCLAVFSRLQSWESAESIASRGAPALDPRCSTEALEPHHTTPNTRDLCARLSCGPGRTSGYRDTRRRHGRRVRTAAGAGAGGDPSSGPRPLGPAKPTCVPAARKAVCLFFTSLSLFMFSQLFQWCVFFDASYK